MSSWRRAGVILVAGVAALLMSSGFASASSPQVLTGAPDSSIASTTTVPDVRHLSRDAATAILVTAGLNVRATTVSVDESIDGNKVWSQTPNPGTTVAVGTTVTIRMGVWNGNRH